ADYAPARALSALYTPRRERSPALVGRAGGKRAISVAGAAARISPGAGDHSGWYGPMAEQEQKPADSDATRAASSEAATPSTDEAPTAAADNDDTAPTAGASAEAGPTGADEAAAELVWEPFDAVLQAFGQERGTGLGTFWGESPAAVEGRFASWANSSGWRC